MKVSEVRNTPSFGMAWDKNAKTALKEIVKKLPAQKAEKVITHINWLEKNSPHHNLTVNTEYGRIFADVLTRPIGELGSFSLDGNITKIFGKIVKFIDEQNELIPRLQKAKKEILPKVTKLVNERNCNGWEDTVGCTSSAEKISTQLAKIAQRKSGDKLVEALIEQIGRIQKKANEADYVIYHDFGFKINVFRRCDSFAAKKKVNSRDLPKALNKIEAFLDKQILKKQLENADSAVRESKSKIAHHIFTIKMAKEQIYFEKHSLAKAKKEAAAKKKALRKEAFEKTPLGRFVKSIKTMQTNIKSKLKSTLKSIFSSKKLSDEYIDSSLKLGNTAEKTAS